MTTQEWFDAWSSTPTAKAKFLSAILHGQFLIYVRSREQLFKVCDALAVAVALRPEIVQTSLTGPVAVELQGLATRGQMVRRVKNTEGLPLGPKVQVVIECDTAIVRKLLEDTIAE